MENLNPKRIANILALTPVQEGMLFHYLQDPQGGLYFEQLCLEISGEIDVRHFEKAWNVVIETNEMLRVVFRWDKVDKPVQLVLKKHQFQPRYSDLSGTDAGEWKERLEEIKRKDAQQKFDLKEVPFRVTLCKIEEDKYVIIISNHHILYDGWSTGIILKEFFKVYHELRHDRRSRKLPGKPPFKEFVRWAQSQDRNKQEQFWREYLAGVETPTEIPIKRRIEETSGAEDYSIILEEDLKSKLDAFVKNNRVTLASVFYTAWGILLQKYCDSEDVIFGTTVSGRSADIKGIEDMVGLFINTIPLRTQTTPNEKISDVVFRTDQVLRGREEFEGTPLVDVASYSPVGVGGSLFDTIVAIENYPLDNNLVPESSLLSVHSYSIIEMTHYDLSVGIMPFNENKIKFSYKLELFDKETIENMAGHFKGIIQNMIENPETVVSRLEIISGEEKNRVLYDFNNTAVEYPADKTIHQLFVEQASRTPGHVGLVGDVGPVGRVGLVSLSYRQLNEQSDRLAGLLIEKGVLANDIVGIMVERSIEMVIGIFGILKAGGAYMPIEPSYPQERIDYMLKDSAAKILLNAADCVFNFHHSSFIIHHSNLAYVIYTSGSTGNPKGVIVGHASAVNVLFAMQGQYPFTPADTYLLKTSYIFDVSVTELFGWYIGGGRLAILEKDGEKDPRVISGWIERQHVTHINFVPSMFNVFVSRLDSKNINRLSSLKYIFLAGEALLPESVKKFRSLNASIGLENIYGPTEGTVYSSKYSLSEWRGKGSIPIGRPLPNIELYILNKYNYLQPIGIPGELYISGSGLAWGYLNRPELTAEKFYRSHRSYKTYINYKTGDMARWLNDGNIEFLGRIDRQVKIRGYRIETGEIESQLLKHPDVNEAVVVVKTKEAGTDDHYLCAYIVSHLPQSILSDRLREFLTLSLPEYMVPAYFVLVGKIPLTPSGKLDQRALPEPGITSEQEQVMPRNEIEVKLADIWGGVLGIDSNKIGIDANFFRLGGHSLKLTHLAVRIHRELGIDIPLSELFKLPTIRTQGRFIGQPGKVETDGDKRYIPIQSMPQQEYYDISYAQRRLWIICQFEEDSIAYNEVGGLTIKGKFNPSAFEQAIMAMAQRQESLRTVFVIIDGEPKQKILPHVELGLQQEDLRHLHGAEQEAAAALIIKNTANKAFNLEKGPLAVFKLLRLEDEKYFLLVSIHHIINDGWSIGVIKHELNTLYDFFNKNHATPTAAASAAAEFPLAPLKFQYKDYTLWHNRLITNGYFDKFKDYWLEKFKDKPTGIELPLDHPRGAVQTFNGGRIYYRIEEQVTSELRDLPIGEDSTLFMKLMTILNILLHKYSGEKDIIMGAPIAGRKQPELHHMIGFLVNTLVYRIQVEPGESARQLMAKVKEETLACFENQDYPFDILVEGLGLARDMSRSPLFNVLMAFRDVDGEDIRFDWTDVEFHDKVEGFDPSLFDLVFFFNEKGNRVDCEIMYNSDLFERNSIQRMADNFLTLLKNVLEDCEKPVFALDCITENEYKRVSREFNATGEDFEISTIGELVEEQAAKSPDRVAVVSPEGWTITYNQLNARSNQVAHYIRQEYGVGPGTIVGICIERSLEMIIAVLGVIKSGAGYLSFDPNYPKDRVQHMIQDSRASLVIIDQSRPDLFDADHTLLDIHEHWPHICRQSHRNPEVLAELSDTVYVIYTSGSTGVPNGAMLSHALLANLVKWQIAKTAIDSSLRCLQFTSINFCVSFQEIVTTLSSGGEVHLIGDIERQDIDYLMGFLVRRKIGNLYLPFSYLNFLFNLSSETTFITYLQHIITAGEQLKITGGLKKFLEQNPDIKLHNHYGSSEMHVVTSYTLDAATASLMPVPPAGKPIANTRIYILDEYERPVPMGVWGELFVDGSDQVLGYIHNPELTDKKLVWHPVFSPISGHRLYRSGDVGRWLEDGNIELKGRKDFQVKIRGFRVELSEIESKILALDQVKDCVVVVKENVSNEKTLVAYVVAHDLDIMEIKRHLGSYLPQYMIPKFMVLESLPLMPNGKVDREKLPELTAESESAEQQIKDFDSLCFENEIEEKLAGIWAELLGVDKGIIGKDDNFFELGGHSLKATAMMTRIHKEFNVRVKLIEIFKTPTISSVAGLVRGALAGAAETVGVMEGGVGILPVEKKDYYIVSSAQKRMYILQQMEVESIAYNMPRVMELEGEVDIERLKNAVKKLIQRHEAFRTSFEIKNDKPVQIIHGKNKSFAELFQKRLPEEWQPPEAMIKSFIRPFDLSCAPLLRVELVKLSESRHFLMVDMHHIISDGISIDIMVNDFMALYAGQVLPELRIQYKDYAEWIQGAEMKEGFMRQEVFWLRALAGEVPVLDLPTDFVRPVVQGFEGSQMGFRLGKRETAVLNRLAQSEGVTLFMLVLAIYNVFLSRVCGQEEVVVGVPEAGRRHTDLEGIIGMFVNTLALRNYPSARKTFSQFLNEVKQNTLEVFENQDYPFEELVGKLAVARDLGRNPVFDTLFALQNVGIDQLEIPGLKLKQYETGTTFAKFDLSFMAVEQDGDISVTVEFCTRLFKRETIARFAGIFRQMTASIIVNLGQEIKGIEMLTGEEKKQILEVFNNTVVSYPSDKTIHQLFEEQAERTPDRLALVGADLRVCPVCLSYRQLNEQSDRLAGLLIEKGVLADNIVGIMIERSIEMVMGIFGILKAGGAYLPIDPGYPQERIDYMLKDSGAKVLIGNEENQKKIIVNCQLLIVNCKLMAPPGASFHHSSFIIHHSNRLSYIIYTSGSTGKSKGVLVEHSSVVNLLYAMQNEYPLEVSDTYLLKTAYVFDVSVTELFGWYMGGSRVAVLEKDGHKDPRAIVDSIERNRVTHINFVPSMFNVFIEHLSGENKRRLSSLKYIFLAGEALLPKLVEKFRELNTGITLENIYGPTESTVYAGKYSLSGWKGIGNIPIGKPLPNIKLYILNRDNYLQPVGVTGELCISGSGLARGYLNRPELTAEKFIKYRSDRSYKTYIFYKTGDLARWMPDGNIEFLGRSDHQVKIRGFRVEPGEIENRLAKHPGVKEAVVLVQEDEKGDKYLCAYVVTEGENVISELREYLALELPDYMIPSYFVYMDKIPLTPSGKVDRRALPGPEAEKSGGYVEPRNEIDKKLVRLWSEILGRDVLHASQLQTSIGIDDNFFQLGGHSLKATILVSKIHKAFDVKIPLTEIFKRPTIRGFSDYIDDATGEKYTRIEPLEKKEYYPLSSAQKRLYFLQAMEETGTEYNMPQFMKLEGKIDLEKLEDAFVKLIQRHESLRTSFETIDNEPVQRIHDKVEFEIEYDNQATDEHGQTRTFHFIRAFDLSKAPLMRVGLVKEDDEKHLLMVDMHHSITDGVSIGVLVKEFLSLYKGELLPPLGLQYKDFSEWQNREIVEKKGESIRQQEAYWLKEFEIETPVLDLPVDYPRPKARGFEGRGESFIVDEKDTQALRVFAREQGATLYMVLLCIYNIFLARITNQETLVVGTSTAGRSHADLEGIIGMFVNTLALKNEPAGEKSVIEFLTEVREKTLQAFANQEYQYEELVERTVATRDMGRNPLFDTMFVFQNLDIAAMEIPGLKVIPHEYERDTSKFDLTLECIETKNRLRCTLEYSTKLFKKETIHRFIDYHRNIISTVLENSHKRIAEIAILSEEEKKRLVMEFNDTAKEYPGNKTIYRLFEEQVDKIPDHVALIFKDKALTFRHFNEVADRMANYLRTEKQVQVGDRVVVLMDRSIELIISLMGVMKSGGAYVPLDVALPTERLRVVFNDASIGIAVSMQKYLEKLTGLQLQCKTFHSILFMDVPNVATAIHNYPAARPGAGHARNTAYVMYTSGSSGIPKGVLVEHRTIVNTLWWRKNFYGYNPDSVSLQNPPYFFDSSVTDIFTPLLGGARLVLIEEKERMDLAALKKIITIHKVTHFIAVPAFYNVLLEEIGAELACLKMICAAGEYFPDELVKKHFKKLPRVRITNEYGPTENSVNTTIYELTLDSPRAYIGKPIDNVTVYVLDRNFSSCPIGVTGELCLAGSSLARGYLNNPELTAERFIVIRSDWSDSSDRFYKTGDMGRWLPDGNLEFIGRLDNQVKIRGIRIETGEIENHLLRHNNIKEAVVLARDGAAGEKFLCAYIVPSADGNQNSRFGDDLKEYLSGKLPGYMIPSYFIVIAAIPLMANGKINRDALPPLPSTGFLREGSQFFIAPRDENEEKLADIWSEVLGIEKVRIGIDEDFFELGGYSLRATIVASRIHKVFNVKIPLAEIFMSPTIRGLAKYIKGAGEQMYAAIEPVEKREYYTLSAAQKRLYLLYRMDPGNVSYNMPLEIRFQEEINLDRLQGVFKELIDRHESLRTSFEMVNEEPVQRIHDHVEFEIEISKVFGPTFFQKGGFIRPFDLSKAPLLRAVMIKEENGKHLLWADIHHIITDGTSQVILHDEFDKLCREQGADLPALRLQYKDYSQWQNSEQQQALVRKKEPYWLREFGDELPVLNLPIDYARPLIQSSEGNTVEFTLTVEENQLLRRLAREANVTLFMMILAVFNVLLSKLSGQDDIIVGTPVRGRRHADLERIIGMFINTLPLRNKPSGGMKLKVFLNELKGRTLEAYENQEYPFEELVEKISVKRDTSRNPVFDVMFNLLNREGYLGDIPGEAEMHEYKHKKGTSKFDLMLTAVDLDERLLFIFEYCSRLFEPVTIERFIAYFKRLMYWLRVLPDPGLSELEIITEEEKHKILSEFNGIKIAYPADKTIHQLFAEQVEKSRDRVGIVGLVGNVGNVGHVRPVRPLRLTYRQLNEQSDRLAGFLIEKGVLADSIVGIMMDRTIDLVIGILGILKAGGAYLPIDSEYPVERKRYMIEDGEVRHLLVSNDIGDIGPDIINRLEAIDMRQEEIYKKKNVKLDYIGNGSNLVYVIYTSGTTGKPKGVMLEQRNLVNLILYQYEKTNIDFNRVLQFTTISFDVSAQEIFSAFLWGGELYLVSNETRTDIPRLFKLIEKNGIKTVFLPVSFLKVIFKEEEYINLIPRCIRHITTAGEQLVVSNNFKNYLREGKVYLHNHYGPAEAHVVTTLTIDPGGDIAELPSIGKPVMNTRIYIVDLWGRLLPPGVVGEIRIGGVQVGRGYLNRPELTAEKFIMIRSDWSDLSDSSDRFYKTGDLARWLDDGNIEFLGRMDQQVKIRGFRIELAEIENRLKEYPVIKEAVVIDRKDNERKYLCAYIVVDQTLAKGMVPVQQLKEYLEAKLPSYMVPACFVEIDKIPLKANGKIDRDRLPAPMESDFRDSGAYQAPGTDIQRTIAAIWEDVLGREKIGIRDNFFDLGGNSLDFVRVSNKLKEKLGQDIPVVTLFTYPTISSLEHYLSSVQLPVTSSLIPVNFVMLNSSPQSRGNIFFIHEILGDVGAYIEFCKQLGAHYNCWGVEAEKLRNYVPRNTTIEEIAAKYISQMKEIQPQGPYFLATWSWGGHLSLEMTLQLEQMGEPLAMLAFFDCLGPECVLGKTSQEFTLETEKNLLRDFFITLGNEAELEKINDIEQLWIRAVDILTGNDALVEQLRQILIENALALPDYDYLTGEQLIQYLNLNRTHLNASAKYIPSGKIQTPIHYFAANQNTERVDAWGDYCHTPINYHEINGDHHSIFRNKEHIAEFARLFNEILENIVRLEKKEDVK